jgi:hypothetical protein
MVGKKDYRTACTFRQDRPGSLARLAAENAQFSFELGSISGIEARSAETAFKALLLKYEAEAEELEFSLTSKHIGLRNFRLTRENAGEALAVYRTNAVISVPSKSLTCSHW